MRAADLVTASALMLLGAVVLADALRLGIGWSTDGPRSGFFPSWLALLMLAACATILVHAWRGRPGKAFIGRAQVAPVLKVLAPATGMVLLTHWLGLYVSSALYLGLSMRWIGRHRWPTVVAVAVGVPIATFLIFERWFLVPMPKGPLETWLGY